MNNIFLVGIVIILIIGGGWFVMNTDKTEETEKVEDVMMQETADDVMMETNHDGTMDDSMEAPKKDGEAMMETEDGMTMKTSGSYQSYSPEKLALATDGDVLLFFHADWCPTCRGIENEINADVSKIPDGVHILKIDYDTAMALRQKYGVTVQHTFVQVDAKGSAVQKFSDASSLSQVLARVK